MVSWRNSQVKIAAVHLKNTVQGEKALKPMKNLVFMPPIILSNSTSVSWIQELCTREIIQAFSSSVS